MKLDCYHNMETINAILDSLSKTPIVLKSLLSTIPEEKRNIKRLPDKWSVHEQVCHLAEAQQILIDRFVLFENSENPMIKNYEPSSHDESEKYILMDMEDSLNRFAIIRKEMIEMLKAYPVLYWDKKGRHESFEPYSTRILLTHCLNVDYAHLFSIEQLGLTKFGKEKEIMVLP